MNTDITKLILTSSYWFFFGILLYYFLSLIKVHILWYIQPKIYLNVEPQQLFKGYFSNLLNKITNSPKILIHTLRYLFIGKESGFKIIKDDRNKPVIKILNILDGLTIFLKPFIVFSIIWVIIKYFIERKFFYDPMTITLGEIQLFLNEINQIKILLYMSHNKGLIFLLYALLCILIPFLYEREEQTKKVKKYFSLFLAYFSIIGSVSFFGAKSGIAIDKASSEFTTLKAEVDSIHNQIFKKSLEIAIIEDIKEKVINDDDKLSKIAKQNQEKINKITISTKNIKDAYIVIDSLNLFIDGFNKHSILEDLPIYDTASEFKGREYTSLFYINEVFREEGDNYFGNRNKWSKTKGLKILSNVEKNVEKVEAIRINKDKGIQIEKLSKIIDAIFDFGLGEGSAAFFETVFAKELKLNSHKTLKKVVDLLLSSKYKEKLNSTIIKAVKKFSDISIKKSPQNDLRDSYQEMTSDKLRIVEESNADYISEKEMEIENMKLKEKISEIISKLKSKDSDPNSETKIRTYYEEIYLNIPNENNQLKLNYKLKKSYNEISKLVDNASNKIYKRATIGGYEICPICFMPAIPNTPCIRIVK